MFGENTDEKRKKERSVCYFSYDVCYFSYDLFVGCCFVVVGVFVGFFSSFFLSICRRLILLNKLPIIMS